MLTWPQNARNPISEEHSFKFFWGANIFLNPLKGTTFSGLDMTINNFFKNPVFASEIHSNMESICFV